MSLASIPQNSRLGRTLSVLRDVMSRPSGAVGLCLVVCHLILAMISPYIAPFDYRTMNAAMMLTGPDGVHLLGTDHVSFTGYAPDLVNWPKQLGGVRRSWTTLSQAADEAGASREYGGIHWEADNTEGLRIGRLIADTVFDTALPRLG